MKPTVQYQSVAILLWATLTWAQQAPRVTAAKATDDPIEVLVGRLNLERYKATIKSLTRFGDRRQGTDRNREALDWIEAQLKSYGRRNTERIHYNYQPPAGRGAAGGAGAGGDARDGRGALPGRGGGRGGNQSPTIGPGGARRRGVRTPDTVNNDPLKQPDLKLRELDSQPSTPGPREEVYCTKIGATHPEEMYIVGAHMDGIGFGEAANDDGSGTALVMEIARIFSSPEVQTTSSIRFALWNNEPYASC